MPKAPLGSHARLSVASRLVAWVAPHGMGTMLVGRVLLQARGKMVGAAVNRVSDERRRLCARRRRVSGWVIFVSRNGAASFQASLRRFVEAELEVAGRVGRSARYLHQRAERDAVGAAFARA